jgi:uncharacterized protein (TIGR00369 family)
MTAAELTIEHAHAVLRAQPFSVLLGAELERFEPGRASLTVPLRDDVRQQHGVAHGGLLSYAADNAITFAAGSVAGADVLRSAMQINYLTAARGTAIEAVADVVDAGRRIVTVRCDVFDVRNDDRQLCAVAQGTVVRKTIRPPPTTSRA